MTNREVIGAAQLEMDRLEFLLQLTDKQITQVAELMKNQGLSRLDGAVDSTLVQQHERLTDKTDKILDRMTELQKEIAALRNG